MVYGTVSCIRNRIREDLRLVTLRYCFLTIFRKLTAFMVTLNVQLIIKKLFLTNVQKRRPNNVFSTVRASMTSYNLVHESVEQNQFVAFNLFV